MLKLMNTRFKFNDQVKLAPGVTVPEAGIVLSLQKLDGELVGAPSVAGDKIFGGIALTELTPPAVLPIVEAVVVAASVALTRKPIAAQLLVKIAGVKADIVAGTPAAGEVQLSGANLNFNAADQGKQASVQYLYYPTVLEAQMQQGSAPLGGLAANATGVVSVIKTGQAATSFYDASADWTDAVYVKMGDGGRFVPGTDADHINGALVVNTPNAANPFLVVELNVA